MTLYLHLPPYAVHYAMTFLCAIPAIYIAGTEPTKPSSSPSSFSGSTTAAHLPTREQVIIECGTLGV